MQWSGDCAFERLEAWFDTLPVPIETRVHDDDCAICRAMREGADEGELIEAFAEQNAVNVRSRSYTEQNTDAAAVERQLAMLLTQYKLDGKLSVDMVRGWVLSEEGDPLVANKEYFAKWHAYFDMDFDDPKFESVMNVFTDAWNFFPHRSLGGKSPRDLYDEETRGTS